MTEDEAVGLLLRGVVQVVDRYAANLQILVASHQRKSGGYREIQLVRWAVAADESRAISRAENSPLYASQSAHRDVVPSERMGESTETTWHYASTSGKCVTLFLEDLFLVS